MTNRQRPWQSMAAHHGPGRAASDPHNRNMVMRRLSRSPAVGLLPSDHEVRLFPSRSWTAAGRGLLGASGVAQQRHMAESLVPCPLHTS
jgi:hypothetical protein